MHRVERIRIELEGQGRRMKEEMELSAHTGQLQVTGRGLEQPQEWQMLQEARGAPGYNPFPPL